MIKRKLNRRLIRECRCDERLKAWGTGTPKDRDEVNKREVCECDGWVCDLDDTGTSSIFKIIRNTTVLVRMLPSFDLICEEKSVRRKWNWSLVDYVSWTPEVAKKRSVSRWSCKNRRRTNSLCNLPDVLEIVGILPYKNDGRGGVGRVWSQKFYLFCHTHLDTSVSRT